MDAYEYLKGMDQNLLIEEDRFYRLIHEFQKSYLEQEDYLQRIQRHRNPVDVSHEVLRKLYDYDNAIQYRTEMRDEDTVNAVLGYVPSVIKELWKSDKNLKSLYKTVQRYCELR